MEESQLKMNDSTTGYIVIGILHNLKKTMSDMIEIGEIKIHQTPKIKFLGVHLDEVLNSKDHSQIRTKKATVI